MQFLVFKYFFKYCFTAGVWYIKYQIQFWAVHVTTQLHNQLISGYYLQFSVNFFARGYVIMFSPSNAIQYSDQNELQC